MPVLQIMKEVGKEWKSLDSQGKVKYQALADQDKIRYKYELKQFEKEVEKLQVTKPGKGKARAGVKRKSESTEEVSPKKLGSPEKSDFKRKFLESESTDYNKVLADTRKSSKEETKNEVPIITKPILIASESPKTTPQN